jgi:hypothetical protein
MLKFRYGAEGGLGEVNSLLSFTEEIAKFGHFVRSLHFTCGPLS